MDVTLVFGTIFFSMGSAQTVLCRDQTRSRLKHCSSFGEDQECMWGWLKGRALATQALGPKLPIQNSLPQKKSATGVHICNPSTPVVKWEVDTGEGPEAWGQLGWSQKQETCLNKVEGAT